MHKLLSFRRSPIKTPSKIDQHVRGSNETEAYRLPLAGPLFLKDSQANGHTNEPSYKDQFALRLYHRNRSGARRVAAVRQHRAAPQIGSLGRLFGFMVRGIYYANMTWRACSQRGWW